MVHQLDAAGESAGHLEAATSLIEPGSPAPALERPAVDQPAPVLKAVPWRDPKPVVGPAEPDPRAKRVVSGTASWYDNGTTAMRLPLGTRVKVCGARACVVRVVRDWGPASTLGRRVADLTPEDFVAITGRSLKTGLAPVTVYIY